LQVAPYDIDYLDSRDRLAQRPNRFGMRRPLRRVLSFTMIVLSIDRVDAIGQAGALNGAGSAAEHTVQEQAV